MALPSRDTPVSLTTVLSKLDGTPLAMREAAPLPRPTSADDDVWPRIAEVIAAEIKAVKAQDDRNRARRGQPPSKLLGAGVEVATHVHNGQIVLAAYRDRSGNAPLAVSVSRLLDHKPVIVENDVNALAIMATHQPEYQGLNMVIAAVFDEGVGGGLIMDGRVRRGTRGMAMEIGHLLVEPHLNDDSSLHRKDGDEPNGEPSETEGQLKNFFDECSCGQQGHVDVLATPSRIRGQLGTNDLAAAATAPSTDHDGQPTAEYQAFARGGVALGRGLAATITLVNPEELVLKLPPVLIESVPERAASAYLAAVRHEITTVFSTGATDAELIVEPFKDVAVTGARAAAICMIDAFIAHARGLDTCNSPAQRQTDARSVERTAALA